MDAAGNTATRWFEVNPDANKSVPALFIPWTNRYNESHMQVNIPYHDNNTRSFLQLSYDKGQTWQSTPFNTSTPTPHPTPENTTFSALFREDSRDPWYRVRYIRENVSGYSYTLQKHVGSIDPYYVRSIDNDTLSIGSFGRNYPEEIKRVVLVDKNGNYTEVSFNLTKVNQAGFELVLNQSVTGSFVQLIGSTNTSLALRSIRDFIPMVNLTTTTTTMITSSTSSSTTSSSTSSSTTPSSTSSTSSEISSATNYESNPIQIGTSTTELAETSVTTNDRAIILFPLTIFAITAVVLLRKKR
jgi:hypothetical protein